MCTDLDKYETRDRLEVGLYGGEGEEVILSCHIAARGGVNSCGRSHFVENCRLISGLLVNADNSRSTSHSYFTLIYNHPTPFCDAWYVVLSLETLVPSVSHSIKVSRRVCTALRSVGGTCALRRRLLSDSYIIHNRKYAAISFRAFQCYASTLTCAHLSLFIDSIFNNVSRRPASQRLTNFIIQELSTPPVLDT